MRVNKTLDNWLKKWRKYIFIIVAIAIVFLFSIIMIILRMSGIIIPYPNLWNIIALVIGILILIFCLILLGYLLLMVRPGSKPKPKTIPTRKR